MLAILVLAGILLKKKTFWISCISVSCILSVLTIATFSRSAIMALFLGFIIIYLFSVRKFEVQKRTTYIVCCILIGVLALTSHKRLSISYMIKDKSISDRFLIWGKAPKMMVDFPKGMKSGEAGEIYSQWYQNTKSRNIFTVLVNSHLQYLVEFSWAGRIAYIFLWLLVLFLVFPSIKNSEFTFPFTIIFAFTICTFFNSITNELILWILPMAGLFFVIAIRIKKRLWLTRGKLTVILAVSAIIIITIFIKGKYFTKTDDYIKITPAITIVGKNQPSVWIVPPYKRSFHFLYGLTLRKYYNEIQKPVTFAVINEFMALPQIAKGTIVIWGTIEEITDKIDPKENLSESNKKEVIAFFNRFDNIILMRPGNYSSLLFDNLGSKQKVFIYWGTGCDGDLSYWKEMISDKPNIKFTIIEGKYGEIPNWINIVINISNRRISLKKEME
ncbi:MAG: O-antigen ligase family protein [Candidatus Firestonebacteria bacterium]